MMIDSLTSKWLDFALFPRLFFPTVPPTTKCVGFFVGLDRSFQGKIIITVESPAIVADVDAR